MSINENVSTYITILYKYKASNSSSSNNDSIIYYYANDSIIFLLGCRFFWFSVSAQGLVRFIIVLPIFLHIYLRH